MAATARATWKWTSELLHSTNDGLLPSTLVEEIGFMDHRAGLTALEILRRRDPGFL